MKEIKKGLIEIGTVLSDNWVMLELIGQGGMGEVYRAHQLNLRRDVAIKIVSQKFLETVEEDDREIETARSRFRREVKAMAQVRHPNVVQIFDYGSTLIRKGDEEIPIEYIVMEYIPGTSLRLTMPQEGFYPQEREVSAWILEYFFPVLDGVQALHEAGIIHRDLKPENFLLDGDIPKISDFGLARSVKLESVTESMDVMGTPPYMAPDHFYDFKRVDQRGDIYSLGKILFEAVEGKMPPTTIPFKSAKLSKSNTPFFQALDRVIQDATAEDKNNRLKSAERFRNALQQAIDSLKTQTVPDSHPSSREPSSTAHFKWLWLGIAVAIISVAAMTVWHLVGNPWGQKQPLLETGITRQKSGPSTTSKLPEAELPATGGLAKSIMGNDGITTRLIPGGALPIETGEGGSKKDTVQLQPFYLDETKVTVHHFVDFLNSVRHELNVKNGVVKRGGEIWVLLGDGSETGDQIIYRHDRFHIPDLKNAAQPAVRVTWYGASAYARYFDKRLPTEDEWEYAAQNISLQRKRIKASIRTTEENPPPNKFGLENIGGSIKEWVVRVMDGRKSGQIPVGFSYSSLVVGKSFPTKEPGPQGLIKNFSYPWEGFFDVGFRCAANANLN